MTVLSYPRPIYSNPPIKPQDYKPSRFVISAISQGLTTTITTSEDHNYVVGQQIRFIIPPDYGMRELDKKQGIIIFIPSSTQFVIQLDTRGFNSFLNPGTSTKAQTLAIGDINSGIIATNGINISSTNIPGSFVNIS